MKVAHLSDMFQKLNELNLQMQGINTHLPHLADKITSFTRKLEMWEQRVKEGNIDSFENLKSFTEVNKLQNTMILCMKAHISALQKNISRGISQCRILNDTSGSETPSVQHHLRTSALQRRNSSLVSPLIQQRACSLSRRNWLHFGLEWRRITHC